LLLDQYLQKNPNSDLKRRISGTLPENWDKDLPTFKSTDAPVATRTSSGNILNHFSKKNTRTIWRIC